MREATGSAERTSDPRTWWMRPGLEVLDGRLTIAGRDAEALAREHGTPLFAYDLTRVEEQVRTLQEALSRAGLSYRVRLALKAQREPEVLRFLRGLGAPGAPESVGIDACSPREVLHALERGWLPDEISYTGTNVSDRDLDVILETGVHLNVDLVTQVARVGRRAPDTRIGIRVNPRAGAAWRGYDEEMSASLYSSAERVSKFGILEESLDEAVEVARRHGLEIDTVHFHVGDGFLTDGLPAFGVAVERVVAMARRLTSLGCPISEVNAGGGLGVPQQAGDEPLDVDALAGLLARHLGPLGVVVSLEPGDFLVKESAVLLGEVVTVERRAGKLFVGLDTGYNVAPEHFIYGDAFELILCRAAGAPRTAVVTISGNINEGDDLWAEDYPFPAVEEGDVVAVYGVGSYGSVMAVEHCLRSPAGSVFFRGRT